VPGVGVPRRPHPCIWDKKTRMMALMGLGVRPTELSMQRDSHTDKRDCQTTTHLGAL